MFIAMSLDGFIAKPNDDLSFLKIVERPGEDYGYRDFVSEIDTIIIGRKTYDFVKKNIGLEHYDNGERDVFVITRSPRKPQGRVHFIHSDLEDFVRGLKQKGGKHIYCDGGAEIINALLREDLIDVLIISIIPVLLGEGTRLFQYKDLDMELRKLHVKSFDSGLVQVHYRPQKTATAGQ